MRKLDYREEEKIEKKNGENRYPLMLLSVNLLSGSTCNPDAPAKMKTTKNEDDLKTLSSYLSAKS